MKRSVIIAIVLALTAWAMAQTPEPPKADVAALHAEIRHLRAENARLRYENEQLKKQVAESQPADAKAEEAAPLTPAQMAQQRREQAQAARLQRQIEHWRREEKKAQKEYDAVQNWGLDSTIKRKYVTRNGRRYYRDGYGPNGPGPDMARAKDALDKAKARLAELEKQQVASQAPADQVDDAPADAEPLTPAQMAAAAREQAEAQRLQRQIDHWKKQVVETEKAVNEYRSRHGRNIDRSRAERAKLIIKYEAAKARLAELEAKQAEAQQEK